MLGKIMPLIDPRSPGRDHAENVLYDHDVGATRDYRDAKRLVAGDHKLSP